MSKVKQKSKSKTQIRLYADIVLFFSMVLAFAPFGTGIPAHEWIGFIVIIPLLVHLILDWDWIVSVTKRMFKRTPGQTRFNYGLDWLLFVMITLSIFSGAMISVAALPALGFTFSVEPNVDLYWLPIHTLTSNLLLPLIGIHLAMHGKWIVSSVKKYILKGA